MTAPYQDMSQWTWESMLQNVLGEGRDGPDGTSGTMLDRRLVAGPDVRWLRLVDHLDDVTESSQPPSDGDVTNRIDSLDGNEFFLYRISTVGSVRDGKPHYTTRTQFIQVKIVFSDSQTEGAPSPRGAFETFYKSSEGALQRLTSGTNPVFSWKSFTDAAKMLHDVETSLVSTERELKTILDRVGDDASGFQGNASGVFIGAVANMRRDVHRLAVDMNANSTDRAWSDQVDDVVDDMTTFRNKIASSFREFSDHTFQWFNGYNPTTLIDSLKKIVTEVRTGNFSQVTITLPDAYGNGSVNSGTFNLMTEAGWQSVDNMIKGAWLGQLHELDATMRTELALLTTRLRSVTHLVSVISPPPTTTGTTPPPGGTPNLNGPDLNGGGGPGLGGGGDLGLGGGGDLGLGGGGDLGLDGGGGDLGLGGGGDLGLGGGGDLGLGGGGGLGAGGDLGLGGGSALGGGGDLGLGGGSGLGSGGGSGAGGLGLDGGGELGTGVSGGGLGGLGGGGIDWGDLGGGTGSGSAGGGGVVVPGLTPGLGGLGNLGSSGGSGGLGGVKGGGAGGLGDDTTNPSAQFPTDVDGVDVGNLGGGSPGESSTSGVALGSELAALLGEPAGLGPGGSGARGVDSAGSAAGGFPMMPPMGGMGGMGGGGQQGEKDRERKTWLEEEEDVWGTDPECGMAVIGRSEHAEEPATTMPAAPRRPGQSPGPTRTTGRRRG
ncbi:hypothetical protein [Micromonospora humida]|uniref:Uncharacterized protein n=1 Tax=Micromonospora humida TaxID=2809018 RepID=A0ABS2ILM8_9ACTN|nr:hypothetical protein [Micromonospora humida]MBM7075245.1 hypothetical protein [Micromonospora humida]